MACWLVKSEPDSWSWTDMVEAGAAGTPWSGVRNHAAANHMKAMRPGEHAFFYHSNEGKAVVGLVEVVRAYHPDPSDASGRFGMVDVRAARALPRPVTLAAIRAEPSLSAMVLVRNSRLSVQPVTADEWAMVCAMGGLTGSLMGGLG